MNKILAWLSTSTSGQGMAALLASLTAAQSGAISHPQALAGVVGAIALILFPQDQKVAAAAQTATLDIEKVVDAYRLGVTHGTAASTPAPTPLVAKVA